MGTNTRTWAVGAVLLPPVVLAVVVWRLIGIAPALVPTHWGPHGVDTLQSPGQALVVPAVLAAVGVVAAVVAVLRVRDPWTARLVVAVGAGFAAMGCAIWTTSVLLAASTDDVRSLSAVGPVAASTLALVVWGAVAFVLMPTPPRRVVLPDQTAPAHVGPGTVWVRTAGSPWAAGLGIAALAAAVVVAVPGFGRAEGWETLAGIAGSLALAGIALAWIGYVRVRVDVTGLHVSSVALGWTLLRARAADIAAVAARDTSPGEWGGWGLRINARGVAYVIRSGPALVVTTTRGRERVVSLMAAPEAAAVLKALVAPEHDSA